MTSSTNIASSILTFSEAEYAAPDQVDLGTRELHLLDSDFIGIAINAPRRVSLAAAGALPVAVATRLSGDRDWDLPLRYNSFLIAADLSTGAVQIAPGLLSEKAMESRAGRESKPAEERPSAEELEGEGAQITWTEATERIDMPGHASRWTLGMIYFDWVSNIVSVDVASDQKPPDPEPRTPYPAPSAKQGMPTYHRTSNTPTGPEYGANFGARFDATGEQQKLYVSGTFAGPLRPFSVAKSSEIVDCGKTVRSNATVPVSFLVVGVGWQVPWQFDWAIPVYDSDAAVNKPVSGCFMLDAFENSGAEKLKPGKYATYLVVDGVIFGPRMIDVLPP